MQEGHGVLSLAAAAVLSNAVLLLHWRKVLWRHTWGAAQQLSMLSCPIIIIVIIIIPPH
jgi:hypothetical protein